jgi:ribonuclease VapC
MVVDTSAITAMLVDEPERELFEDLILRTPTVVISVTAVVEISIVLRQKRRDHQADKLDELLSELRIDVRAIDPHLGTLARDAFALYGKGRHPAALNFGDCFSYALAKARDDVLLFKGDDFARTDIVPAWRP